ncbi:MAG: hypothetical protein Q8K51_16340, partial [Nitrospirota bacterium]|nr:hypothetical protein [Nitrospirota bacterium]
MKVFSGFTAFVFLLMFSANVLPVVDSTPRAEKAQKQNPSLPKEHVQKLKRIAEFVAGEMARKGIKTVTVEDFKNFKGNPSAKGSAVAKELRKQLVSISNMDLKVMDTGAEA